MAEPTLTARVAGSAALRRRQWLGRRIAQVLGRVRVDGAERVPAAGPVILALNHRSMLDGPLVFGVVGRPVSCLVKAEAFHGVMASVLRDAGQLAVVRETIDPLPVRACLQILDAGGVIGIFPEGTRGAGWVTTAKPGVGYLALRTGATVVPVACHGTAEMVRSWRRTPVTMTFGEPITFDRWPRNARLNRRVSAVAAEQVRGVLAELVLATRDATASLEAAA